MFSESLRRQLPRPLADLATLALDLRWSPASHFLGRLWESLDADAWERTKNPHMILMNAGQERLEALAADRDWLAEFETWLARYRQHQATPGWFATAYGPELLRGVAYFSMEFGLSEALPIYSGGLGILAGDHLKSASDLGAPLVGVGLLYQQGYFRQVLDDDGSQLEAFPYNDPGSLPVAPMRDDDGRWLHVDLELPGRTLRIRIWQAQVGRAKLLLLDTNDPLNSPWDRGITANLYSAGRDKRLLQEIVLGVGGWRLVEQLGLDIEVCHLNEGHAAFAVLARAASFARQAGVSIQEAWWATRAGNVFTTHTPVAAAFDQFDPPLLIRYAAPFLERTGFTLDRLLALGRRNPADDAEPFNMAYLALRGCGRVNAVSRLHGAVSRGLFNPLFPRWPTAETPIGHVTNGVHMPTWDSPAANQLWKRLATNGPWLEDLDHSSHRLDDATPADLWRFRTEARCGLVDYVRRRLVRQVRQRGASEDSVARAAHALDPNTLTLGFARRFTPYKRPNLLLFDRERLRRLLHDPQRPLQLIVAGKAHPNDHAGKEMVREMARFAMDPAVRDRVVFLEDYDMVLAQQLAGGIDVWINTPLRPNEACGTSGMKMLVNGGLHLSVLDGWWDEAYDDAVGWCVGDRRESAPDQDAHDAARLYDLLEHVIAPEFYHRDAAGLPPAWVERVRASMSRLTPRFSSDRMVRDYIEQAYLPAAAAYRRRAAEQGRLAHELAAWAAKVRVSWENVRLGELAVVEEAGGWRFDVQAYLGDLSPDEVRVELYAESADGQPPRITPLKMIEPLAGAVNGYAYRGLAPKDRPAEHYTPRLRPYHDEAQLPLELAAICWRR